MGNHCSEAYPSVWPQRPQCVDEGLRGGCGKIKSFCKQIFTASHCDPRSSSSRSLDWYEFAASVYPGNIVVIIIFSPSMFGHIGQQCELSGLESIKQLRLHSPNFAHIIGITITKYICQDYHQDFISTYSPSPSAPRSSAVSNIMKDHSTKGWDNSLSIVSVCSFP